MNKKPFIYIITIILVLSICPVVYADDNEGNVDDVPSIVIDNTLSDKIDSLITTLQATPKKSDVEIVPSNTEIEVLKISANQTSGLHSVLLSLIGDYNPIVKDYTYQSSNGYTSHSIDIQPDWSWIMTAILFIIIIYCVFRLFGIAVGGIR